MNAATLLAIFVVPVLYVVVERLTSRRSTWTSERAMHEVAGD
jgi:hypothetical protein